MKRVKDLMIAIDEYASVSVDSTLAGALEALRLSQPGVERDLHRHRAVLVLDAAGRVVGKLTHWAVLRSLEPKLLTDRDMASLSRAGLSPDFIRTMADGLPRPADTFGDMCRAAARIPVQKAMLAAEESIDEEATLMEAIRYLVLTHAQSTLVTRSDRVVGILRLTDVFDEVARGIRGETQGA